MPRAIKNPFRIRLIIILIIAIALEMGALFYADTTRIEGSITHAGAIILIVVIPISGFLFFKFVSMLYLTKDE